MSFGRLLGEAVAMSRKYPLIFVPVLIVTVVVGLLTALFAGGLGAAAGPTVGMGPGMVPGMGPGVGPAGPMAPGWIFGSLWLGVVWAVLSGVILIGGHAVTVLMVGEVLRLGKTSLSQGLDHAKTRLLPLVTAAVITAILVGFGFVFFVLPGLILGFFLLFTFVAVALEEYSAFGGIRKSFLVVKDRIGDAFVFLLLLIAFGVLFGLVNRLILFIPVVGGLISYLLGAIYSGYTSILVVLAYRELNPTGLAGPTGRAPFERPEGEEPPEGPENSVRPEGEERDGD